MYVEQPDAAYGWRDTAMRLRGSSRGTNWSAALLDMTSQQWLADEVTPSSWNHSLVIISPDNAHAGWCLVYVALGFYGSSGASSAVTASDPDVVAAADIAVAAGIPVAVLFNVPAELLTFKHASSAPMMEDATLSHSWALFTSQPFGPWKPDPQLLAELPMTKAVVRALDTIGSFALATDLPGFTAPLKFAVFGTSKRGHLCWHVASVDSRVQAIIPVAKALNMDGFSVLTQKQLGGIPKIALDYAKTGLLGPLLDTPQGRWFVNITDAYSYIDRFAGLPKLMIHAGNDEFFVPDHTRVWWPAVPQPKWHLMIPNSGHIAGGQQMQMLVDPVSAFLSGLVHGQDPSRGRMLTWDIRPTGVLTAKLDKHSLPPSAVHLWEASTCNAHRRDFRLHNGDTGEACRACGEEGFPSCLNRAVSWRSSVVEENEHRSYSWEVMATPHEDGRWTAFFLSFQWPDGFRVSTEVSVVPTTMPFPECPPGCDSNTV